MNFGPAYVNDLPLVERCYAYAAQSTSWMLAQDEQGRQLLPELHELGRRMAGDFVQARNAWQDAQRKRIQYVESYRVA